MYLRTVPSHLTNSVTVSGIVNTGKPVPTAARIPITNESGNVSVFSAHAHLPFLWFLLNMKLIRTGLQRAYSIIPYIRAQMTFFNIY
jgi:hypothetical protein